jgi:hypothetical protein
MLLLQAAHWWRDAGVVILDEVDSAQLTRTVQLTSADLAAMARASGCPHAKAEVSTIFEGWMLGTDHARGARYASKRRSTGKEQCETDVFRRCDDVNNHDTHLQWAAPSPLPVRIGIDTDLEIIVQSEARVVP